jgi:sulfide dehydrogenase [flavocytochrome c] flavoprotein chain
MKRRDLLGISALTAMSSCVQTRPAAAARVVIIGGGFGGATCARYLRRLAPGIAVTLVEEQSRYYSCPTSNTVIAGLHDIGTLAIDYGALRADGVEVINDRAIVIDAERREVRLRNGARLPYDRAVVAPGIRFLWGSPAGYDEAAAAIMPHAWKAGPQTELLAAQLRAMPDGGVVAISVPLAPFRCPPGPYERASLIAHFLQQRKPRSKLIILDANNKFSKQGLFTEAWEQLYPGLIEWIPVTDDGEVMRVHPATMALHTSAHTHRVAVANVIPAQAAAQIAVDSGLSQGRGWCPVHAATLESEAVPGVHVIGDAAIVEPLPKSASAANSEGKHCALVLSALLGGREPTSPSLHNTCYSLVGPDYGISINGIYTLEGKTMKMVEGAGGVSPAEMPREFRAREARYAQSWYQRIRADAFSLTR